MVTNVTLGYKIIVLFYNSETVISCVTSAASVKPKVMNRIIKYIRNSKFVISPPTHPRMFYRH